MNPYYAIVVLVFIVFYIKGMVVYRNTLFLPMIKKGFELAVDNY
jgi:hypothetical protein